jgi:hypothetical protein
MRNSKAGLTSKKEMGLPLYLERGMQASRCYPMEGETYLRGGYIAKFST